MEGNAEVLPFPDNHFDSYTIAFGIRNVTDRDAALREALRVLKPGGRCADKATSLFNITKSVFIPDISHHIIKPMNR